MRDNDPRIALSHSFRRAAAHLWGGPGPLGVLPRDTGSSRLEQRVWGAEPTSVTSPAPAVLRSRGHPERGPGVREGEEPQEGSRHGAATLPAGAEGVGDCEEGAQLGGNRKAVSPRARCKAFWTI